MPNYFGRAAARQPMPMLALSCLGIAARKAAPIPTTPFRWWRCRSRPAGRPMWSRAQRAPSMAKTLGQSVVIENRTGAGGAGLAARGARRADGYTF